MHLAHQEWHIAEFLPAASLRLPTVQSCIVAHGILECHTMLDKEAVRDLLEPFEICLSGEAIDKLLAYLELLLRWNRKINLTSVTNPRECVIRHFGESLMVWRFLQLEGRLLDIGSGAGFPGLALKLIAPDLQVVLLEPIAKKRAFLKEVSRSCGFSAVQVECNRLQEASKLLKDSSFDLVTARAVGGLETLIPAAEGLLRNGGCLCLWIGSGQVDEIRRVSTGLQWREAVAIPFSQQRQILIGMRKITDKN